MDHPVTNQLEAEGLLIASATDVGRKRTGNEDSHALWVSDDSAVRAKHGMLLVVCDGMGGASAGEVASQLAVETVLAGVRSADPNDPAGALRGAIEAANDKVHTQAAANADQRGMGTTCTAVLLRGREVWVGHVGDSRAYLVRGGKVQKLTRDHSLVAELIEKGHLTEAEAKHDHRRNVVTRSVGALESVQVDAERVVDKLKPGDALVVCSDGLHGQVTDYEIGAIATEYPPAEACEGLIDLANERGGPDNITAIVVRVGGAGAPATTGAKAASARPAAGEPKRRLPPNLGLLGGAAVVMTLLVVAVGAMLLGQLKKPVAGPQSAAVRDGGTAPANPEAGSPLVSGNANVTSPEGAPAAVTPQSEPPVTGAPSSSVAPPATSAAPATPAPTTPRPATPAPKPAPATPKPAAAASGKAGTGTVRLMTRPFQPSTFFVDGDPYAFDVGFLSKTMPAGDHVLRVEGISGGAVDVQVHVEPGGSYSLVAEFPDAGTLGSVEIVLSGASTARVMVDGAQYPEPAPCTVRGLSPGSHRITVVRPKSAPAQGPAEVTVTAGATTRAEYRFGAGR